MTAEEVIAAAREQAGRRGPAHSPLYEWLWSRHESLVPELDPPRTPNWRAMAAKLAEKGVMAGPAPGTDEPRAPTGDLVRRTWAKVVRDKARQAAGVVRRGRRSPPAATRGEAEPAPTPPPATNLVKPAQEGAPPDDDDFPLTFVRLQGER